MLNNKIVMVMIGLLLVAGIGAYASNVPQEEIVPCEVIESSVVITEATMVTQTAMKAEMKFEDLSKDLQKKLVEVYGSEAKKMMFIDKEDAIRRANITLDGLKIETVEATKLIDSVPSTNASTLTPSKKGKYQGTPAPGDRVNTTKSDLD